MTSPFDLEVVLDSFNTSGHWETQYELDNELTTVRFHRSTSDPALAQLQAPPAPDPDYKAPVERLRDYLQKALGVTTGPPVLLTQVLVSSCRYLPWTPLIWQHSSLGSPQTAQLIPQRQLRPPTPPAWTVSSTR